MAHSNSTHRHSDDGTLEKKHILLNCKYTNRHDYKISMLLKNYHFISYVCKAKVVLSCTNFWYRCKNNNNNNKKSTTRAMKIITTNNNNNDNNKNNYDSK